MPNNPSTGQPYTPQAFLEYIRKNINNFIDTQQTSFEPYSFFDTGYNEANIWNSSNALGALLYLDINVVGTIFSNDGAIVCSEHSSSKWRFTTIRAPGAYDHPVSGNREFGYTYDAGTGKYTFYTRGVDRVTELIDQFFANFFKVQQPLDGGDQLWTGFQTGLKNYVNANGGSAVTKPKVTNRPDWDKVKEVLQGTRPVSELGCN